MMRGQNLIQFQKVQRFFIALMASPVRQVLLLVGKSLDFEGWATKKSTI